jgi:hypothetical protein
MCLCARDRKMKVHIKSMTAKQRQRHFPRLPSLLDTAAQHGAKYFNFLPDPMRDRAVMWLEAALARGKREQAWREQLSGEGGEGEDTTFTDTFTDTTSSTSSSGSSGSERFDYASSPAGLAAELDALLQPPPEESQVQVLVLVTDYYQESLELLDHVFATSLFTSPATYSPSDTGSTSSDSSSSDSSRSKSKIAASFRNRAQPWQEQGQFSTSPAEMKALSRLLQMHQALFHACLRSFLRRHADIAQQPDIM